ncbi:hypothetical protein V5E97_09405 [Singulisphaera sp. Ch08]|uniref:DUF4175 family protein n=1 Tax=Singulisphaera sp. Ch08 TaxID=3120278 RepID=A0AAU7CL61_9BACT
MTTATDNTSLGSLREEQTLLRSRLARLRRRLQLQMALEFALDAAAVLVATAAVLVFLDWWFRLGLPARLLLLAATLLGVIPLACVRALRAWRAARLDDLSLAVTLDRFRPGTGGRVADVLQLPDQLGESAESVSPAMIRLAVRQATEALAASDWAALWNRGRTVKRSAALIAALLVPTLFAVLAPQAARLSVARWLQGSSERWPQRTYLTVVGLGDRNRLLAPRDEPFALEVRSDLASAEPRKGSWVVRGRGEPLTLRSLPKAPEVPKAVRVRERTAKGAVRDAIMVATSPAVFRYELPPSSTSTTFDLTGGDDWLGPVKVDRVDRPSLAATKLRVKEPGSPGNDFRLVDASAQHPVFLPDTEVELTLVGSEPIADARLTVHPGQPPKLTQVDARTFAAHWTLREAITLEVQLTSQATGLTSKPAFFSIGLLKDREPRVALRALGVGAHVTPVATIPLSLNATDDLGLSLVRLQLERTTSAGDKAEPRTTKKTVPLPLATDGGRAVLDHQARHDVELQADSPPLGTILRFVAEAEDKCARGVQVGRSAALQFQVVPSDELFYEILIRQRAERAKFVTLYEAAEKRATSLSRSPTPDDYATAMRGLNAGSRQLDLIAGRIADTLQEMKLNQVGSPKSHRLLQEGVIDPIRALNAGAVNELRGVLQSLTGTAPKAGANAESASRLHGEVVTGMKTILDQMSQWESFVDVVNQVAEVIKMQQNVLQAAEKARESRTQEVFDEKP